MNNITLKENEANELKATLTTVYHENDKVYRLVANVTLNDICKNNVCKWSITGDIYEIKKNGNRIWIMGGAIHNEILKHLPIIRIFIDIHGSDCHGAPLYAAENGFYIMTNEGKNSLIDYLRITEDEADKLQVAEDALQFKALLYQLGIVDKWQEESDKAIQELEMFAGCKWVNPYSEEEERKYITFTEEEKNIFNDRQNNGYYTNEAKEERKKAAIEKKRNEVNEKFADGVKKLKREKDIMLYILDAGLPIDNVIYYTHTNEVVFNWKDYDKKITQEEFVDFLNNVDYSVLPKGVTFKIKD